jgi:GMP synthase-like glutamine amidotransferase
LHWHGDNCTLPPACTLLAHNDFTPVQAFWRKPHQCGFQFHLETGPERIEGWLSAYEEDLPLVGMTADQIRSQAEKFGAHALATGRKVFSTWLDIVDKVT